MLLINKNTLGNGRFTDGAIVELIVLEIEKERKILKLQEKIKILITVTDSGRFSVDHDTKTLLGLINVALVIDNMA